MAEPHSIPPFPADIDRDHFGHWLSGFTDGEGSFILGFHNRNWLGYSYHVPVPAFSISLRADDETVLRLIQSFFQCGILSYRPNKNQSCCPQFAYRIRNIPDLCSVIIPHFDTYPLYAKKKRDFAIWKEAVLLMAMIMKRPYRRRLTGRGMAPKWTDEERNCFQTLHDSLRQQRAFKAPVLPLPESSPEPPSEPTLFD